MPAYEAESFDPPAPIARAVVRTSTGQSWPDVPMLLDSGADVSVVPAQVAAAIGASIRPSSVPLRMYDGTETDCDVADLSVEILRYRFQGAFVLLPGDYGVIGRNVLNLPVLTLNGPEQVWSAS